VTAARSRAFGSWPKPKSLLGVPTARLQGTVTGLTAHAFLELVDVAPDGTRVTVDDQVMPVTLPAGAVDHRVALHGIAWRLEPGHRLELEVTTGSTQYDSSHTGPFSVDLTARVRLPVAPAA
jgi:predicted acyl esterase